MERGNAGSSDLFSVHEIHLADWIKFTWQRSALELCVHFQLFFAVFCRFVLQAIVNLFSEYI